VFPAAIHDGRTEAMMPAAFAGELIWQLAACGVAGARLAGGSAAPAAPTMNSATIRRSPAQGKRFDIPFLLSESRVRLHEATKD
jgi:hypothetical protein